MSFVNCAIIRGGSSKGVYFDRDDLPRPGPERDEIILRVYGSPDIRQIDGLGGADKLTSKTAIMGPSDRSDCDIDYDFGQVGIHIPRIDWTSNCGNISAGAALYGALGGLCEDKGDHAVVRIHQVNTGRRLLARVPMRDGQPASDGDFSIGGVPGTAPRIDLDFADFEGCTLGRGLLPTGRASDCYDVPGVGEIDVSVVDMANLHFFVRARDVGLDDARNVDTLQGDAEVVEKLERIRRHVAVACGFLAPEIAETELDVRLNPLLYVIAEPRDYTSIGGQPITADQMNIRSWSTTRRLFSKAHPASGSIGCAIACGTPGCIPNEVAGPHGLNPGAPYTMRLGHPSGTLEVRAQTKIENEGTSHAVSAVVGRTARLIMKGVAYI